MKPVSGILKIIITIILIIPVLSCCRKNAPQRAKEVSVKPMVVTLNSPEPNKVIKCGDSVKIAYVRNQQNITVDSVAVYEGKQYAASVTGDPGELYWHSADSKMGQNTLRVQIYYSDSLHESHNVNLIVLSDIIPINYKYRVINKFPHDNEAYTQGLVFENGHLYESTGLQGKSTVRIVDIKSGKPLKVVPLAPQYFGEGIALFNDQVYQITWRSQVGFVYDKNTLSHIRSFDYQIREGWGLTSDGKNLIMSDGTSQLFFIEPEYFTQIDQIRVFDNNGMIDSLNEIEYIKGKILANVYGKSFIVILDPKTGKVLGKADFKQLVPKGYENDYGHVLNGIAWNPSTGNLYITGKNWPVLYEIALEPAL